MNKETQDLSWRCLPKETRDEMYKYYQALLGQLKAYKASHFDNASAKVRERIVTLDYFFGKHNLTSDKEPTELLFVERKEVIEYFAEVNKTLDTSTHRSVISQSLGKQTALKSLFGDKCLPDTEPSVQREPRFKVGDKFRFKKNHSEVHTVASIFPDGRICFWEKDADGLSRQFSVNPEYIEPYTEPETKDNNNMEEKELNLCELLKDCEGEEFYSLMFGEVTFEQIIAEPNLSVGEKPIVTSSGRYLPNAMYGLEGVPTIFPSRALYEKYPLDAAKAWRIWAEERKPKVKLHVSYDIIQGCLHGCGDLPILEFRTKEEAQQAAEAVRRTLEDFHKNHTEP